MLESLELYLRSQGKTEDTIHTYMRSIMRYMSSEYASEDPECFVSQYQKWIFTFSKSVSSRNVHQAAGQMFYKHMTKSEGKINFLPIEERSLAPTTSWLTHEQFEELLNNMKMISSRASLYRRNVTIMETFVYTGLKASPVAELTVGDVNFRKNLIHSAGLRIPMTQKLRDSLKQWIEHRRDLRELEPSERKSSPLFLSQTGRKMCRRTISMMIESYYLPGMKITPEILRHTFAKWALKASGNDTELVKHLLGSAHSRYVMPESKYDLKNLNEMPVL